MQSINDLFKNDQKFLELILNQVNANQLILNKSNLEGGEIFELNIIRMKLLIQYLSNNKLISVLDIKDCRITDDIFDVFLEYFKENKSLIFLDISFNCLISKKKLIDLAKILENNRSLIYLKLIDTQLENGGAESFAECLRKNYTLAVIDFCYCKIKQEGFSALIKSVKSNNNIIYMNLFSNDIGEDNLELIEEAIKFNIKQTKNLLLNFINNKARYQKSYNDYNSIKSAIKCLLANDDTHLDEINFFNIKRELGLTNQYLNAQILEVFSDYIENENKSFLKENLKKQINKSYVEGLDNSRLHFNDLTIFNYKNLK